MSQERIEILPHWSAYEKTLFYYIIRYLNDPIYVHSEADWQEFCCFYGFDFSLIAPYIPHGAVDDCGPVVYKGKVIVEDGPEELREYGIDASKFLCHPKERIVSLQSIIADMFRCIFLRRDLDTILKDDTLDSLNKNIEIYRNVAHHITMLNSTICTRECLEKGMYSTEYIPQIAGTRNVQAIEKILRSISFCYDENKKQLINLYHAYRYSTLRTLDMLLLILGLQVIKMSPFFDEKGHDFCDGLLRTMTKLLRNAQVIGIFKNDAYFDRELEWMKRSAEDHTTRLQILYEYGNEDQYSLRLDLPHKGVSYFHLNSQSKGKVEYFPLDEEAYQELIKNGPAYEELFIGYENGLYFLRENAKSLISKPKPGYEDVAALLNRQEHFPVQHQLAESQIVDVLTAWCGLLNSVAGSIPYSQKLDPVNYYRLSKAYTFVEACCYANLRANLICEKDLRKKVLQFLCNSQILIGEEIDAFEDINSMEILDYAIEKLEA